jgi:uncharacterized protein (TIGR02594 family)
MEENRMFYEALFAIGIRNNPDPKDPIVARMEHGEIGRSLETSPDGAFVKLLILSDFARPIQGWAKFKGEVGDLLQQVEAPPILDFSLWAFLKACVDAERRFNDPGDNKTGFFITADFLIAWADIESKIKNIGSKNPLNDGVGPFQLSTASWQRFLSSPFAAGYTAADREVGLNQIPGAAFLALDAMATISKAIGLRDAQGGNATTSGPMGPYVPSYIDVLLAMLLSADAAVAIRAAKMDDKGGVAVDAVLAPPIFSTGDLQKLIGFRASLLKNANTGAVETIDGLLINADNLLNSELEKAFGLIRDNNPEDLPKVDGAAPWMVFAQTERDSWLSQLGDNEATAAGTKRVLDYFNAIHFQTPKVEPWCGAFAGFCLTKCDPPVALPAEPARAASWANWGNVSVPLGQPDVPPGAIVVLSPDTGTTTIGHVGFFSRYFDANTDLVEILGGNQSDTVRLSKFARSKIVGIRWFSPIEQREDSSADQAIGQASAGQFSKLLDFIAGFESNGNYNAFFGNSTNKDKPQFTAMAIGDVLQWQSNFVKKGAASSAVGRYQFIQPTLSGLLPELDLSSQVKFDEPTQDKLAIGLLKRRGLGRFLAKSLSADDFGVNLAKEWASLPVPKDVKKGKKTVLKGQSFYAGDGLNKALVSVPALMAAISSVLA